MALVKYIRELEASVPVETDEIAFDDGSAKAKKVELGNIPTKFNNLKDTPNDMIANPGKRVQVNPQGTALLYVDAPVTVYKEQCTNTQDIPVSTGLTLGAWKDVCSVTMQRDIEKGTARLFYSMHMQEIGNQTGTLYVGVRVNGAEPVSSIEVHVSAAMSNIVSGFAINSDVAFADGDVITLTVQSQGDHNAFDLSVKGTLEQSYFEVALTDASGTPGASGTGWTYFTGDLPVFQGTTDGIDTIQFGSQDVTHLFSTSTKFRITSDSGTQTFYCSSAAFIDPNTSVLLNGEVSVSGIITSVEYSYEHAPQGFKVGTDNYKFRVKNNDQSISSAVETTLSSYTEEYDINSNFGATGRYTVPVTGIYSFIGTLQFTDLLAGKRVLGFLKTNETNIIGAAHGLSSASAHDPSAHCTAAVYIHRGDTVILNAFQDNGGGRATTNTWFFGTFTSI